LLEAIEIFSKRIREHATRAFDAGLKPIFAWVGPELCIPPLMSPRDFDEFVLPFDKPLCDLIHERGGYVWVHCHGKMGPVLERFVRMGVDVLNPIEPPPMGDITLPEAFARVGDRMGLEGNIETHDLMTATPERMRTLVRQAMEAGKGRRFILCPSSGYMEAAQPTERNIQNLLTYLDEGARCAGQK
jgi:uroporphyrinogen-III decarboxylase